SSAMCEVRVGVNVVGAHADVESCALLDGVPDQTAAVEAVTVPVVVLVGTLAGVWLALRRSCCALVAAPGVGRVLLSGRVGQGVDSRVAGRGAWVRERVTWLEVCKPLAPLLRGES